MTWFYATSVSVTNGQTVVSVNTGDDIVIAQEQGGLIIGTNPPVEIKRTYLDGSSNKKIELSKPWPYGSQTNQPAMAFPTDGDLAAATAVLKQLIDGFALATQADAQAGIENTKPMTALRVKQAMDVLLGTASKLNATTSTTDATQGRVLRVGDFGFGGEVVTPPGGDLDKVVASGIYREENPEHGISFSSTLHMNSNDGRQQLTISRQSYRMAFRGSPFGANGTGDPGQYWTRWAEVFHNYNIVGPVYYDTLNAVPTGGIIERGSNANGEYVKFADGTMRCTHSYNFNSDINVAEGALYRSAPTVWTFPAVFAGAPGPAVCGSHPGSGGWVSHRLHGLGSCQFVISCPTTFSTDGFPVSLVAFGYWR